MISALFDYVFFFFFFSQKSNFYQLAYRFGQHLVITKVSCDLISKDKSTYIEENIKELKKHNKNKVQ